MFRLFPRRPARSFAPRRVRLEVESLDGRELPSVTLLTTASGTTAPLLADQSIAFDRPIYLPLSPTNTPDGAVSYQVSSSNPNLQASLLTGGRSIRFTVTDGNGVNGTFTIRLFESAAPLTTQRLIDLSTPNGSDPAYYVGKNFHRVVTDFVVQGGSPNGDGIGGSTLPDIRDEYNRLVTFASPGIVAMANAGDDNSNAQIFITDPDVALAGRPQFGLNFNHTIVGLLTDGFDVYKAMMDAPRSGQSPTDPAVITAVEVLASDPTNAVLVLTPTAAFASGQTAVITVTPDDLGDATDVPASQQVQFTVTGSTAGSSLSAGANSRPFLGNTPATVTTSQGVPITIPIPFTDIDGDAVVIGVGSGTSGSFTPITGSGAVTANLSVTVNQAAGTITLTPTAGFTGNIDFRIGVRDGVDRTNPQVGLNNFANFDTNVIRLTVTAAPSVSLAVSPQQVTAGGTVTLTAIVNPAPSATLPPGSVEFRDGDTVLGTAPVVSGGQATLTATLSAVGSRTITARFIPTGSPVAAATSLAATVQVDPAPVVSPITPPAAAPVPITADGSGPGGPATVTVRNADGSVRFTVNPFGEFAGGASVTVADVTGDGQPDVIAVPQFGGAPLIKVYDGATGAEVLSFMVFEDSFRGGLNLRVGDFLGLGYAQILVGAGDTGGPRVTLYDATQQRVLLNFFAYDAGGRGGVAVDAGAVLGGTTAYIVTGSGTGSAPEVAVFLAADGTEVGRFAAGDTTTAAGADVRLGDPDPTSGVRRILVRTIPGGPEADFDPTLFINLFSQNSISTVV